MASNAIDRLSPAKSRIFISYGRADGSELAKRLAADLGRDYDVLYDQQFMSAGDWETQIEDVVPLAKLVVYLLTPHSTRRKSVCRDEIAMARAKNIQIIPVVGLSCDPPLQVSRHQRIDIQTLGYTVGLAKLRLLIKKVLAGGSVPPAHGPVSTWSLAPMFNRVLDQHQGFRGLDWVFADIAEECQENHSTRMTLITGRSGAGKSAIIAQFARQSRCGRVLAHHFCQHNIPLTLDPIGFVRHLAYSLGQQLGQYSDCLDQPHMSERLDRLTSEASAKNAIAFFESVILEPLKSLDPSGEIGDGPCWLLVDALDEAVELAGSGKSRTASVTTIVDLVRTELPRLPPWLQVVATCRSGEVPNRLRHLVDAKGRPLVREIPLGGKRYNDDLRDYIKRRYADEDKAPPPDEKIDALIQTFSDNSFLYVKHLVDGVLAGVYPNIQSAPRSLYPIYEDNFRRLYRGAQDKVFVSQVRPLLAAIVTAREPLSVASFNRILPKIPVEQHLHRLAAFLPENANAVSFHKSLADWLRNPKTAGKYGVDEKEGQALLAAFCWHAFETRLGKKLDIVKLAGDETSEYMLRNGVAHCVAAGELEHAIDLLHFIAKNWDETKTGGSCFAVISPERLTQVLLLALADYRPDPKRKRKLDPDHLADLIEDFYRVEPLHAPLKILSRSSKWQEIRERFLLEGNYVLRFAISEVLAEACAEGDAKIEVVYGYLRGDNVNLSELGAYTLRHFYVGEPDSIKPEYLELMGESETYPSRSALGDLLLNLMFQEHRPFDPSKLRSERFWNPVWEHNQHDVWDLNAADPFIAAGYPTAGAAPVSADAGTRIAYRNFQITEILRQHLLKAQDIQNNNAIFPLVDKFYQLGGAPKRISRAIKALADNPRLGELMRLFFAHPLWDVAETAASVLNSIVEKDEGENFEGGGSKKAIVTGLFDNSYWQQHFGMDCYWRVCFGAIETAYQLAPVDNMAMFSTAVHAFYAYPNSRVRALCAENLIAHILKRPPNARGGLLEQFTDPIKSWIADDDCWVLEHVFRLLKALAPEKLSSLLKVEKPTLLDGLGDWGHLTRAEFLTHIEARRRLQLRQAA